MKNLDEYPFEIQQELREIAESHANQVRGFGLAFLYTFVVGVALCGGTAWAVASLTTDAATQTAYVIVACTSILFALVWTATSVVLSRLGRMEMHALTLHEHLLRLRDREDAT